MPFVLYESPATILQRRADYTLLLRQAELRLRSACMRAYAARLDVDADAIDALIDGEPSGLGELELKNARDDARKYALECERLRRELFA